jgi:hypothetical protein
LVFHIEPNASAKNQYYTYSQIGPVETVPQIPSEQDKTPPWMVGTLPFLLAAGGCLVISAVSSRCDRAGFGCFLLHLVAIVQDLP